VMKKSPARGIGTEVRRNRMLLRDDAEIVRIVRGGMEENGFTDRPPDRGVTLGWIRDGDGAPSPSERPQRRVRLTDQGQCLARPSCFQNLCES
jgi:hypothetical protein